MNPEELESRLRTMLAEAGLMWVLQQVDETISAGRAEVVTVKSSRRRMRRDIGQTESIFEALNEEPLSVYEEREPYRVEKFTGIDASKAQISTSPLSASDRVRVLLEAIQRLLVDLPRVHREQVELLCSHEISAPLVDDIEFRRDSGASTTSSDLKIASDRFVSDFAGEELDESVLHILRRLSEEMGHDRRQ